MEQAPDLTPLFFPVGQHMSRLTTRCVHLNGKTRQLYFKKRGPPYHVLLYLLLFVRQAHGQNLVVPWFTLPFSC